MHVTVIAKEPRPGFVKTRLCPPCTPDEAANLAAAALQDTLDAVDRLTVASDETSDQIERVLLFDGDASAWARPGWQVIAQRGDGLAARLANAFDDLGPGVIVGMETPHAVSWLDACLDAIRSGRDAIGLANDGGYWAIALGAVDRRVFDGVPMSASHTGLAQLRALYAHGRGVHRLPLARDLDTYDDVVDAARRGASAPCLHATALGVIESIRARIGTPVGVRADPG